MALQFGMFGPVFAYIAKTSTRMKLSLHLTIAIAALLSTYGCAKNVQKEAVITLCSRNWTCLTVTDNGIPITEPCRSSDMLVFTTQKRGSDYYQVKCDPAGPSETDFEWTLTSDARMLTMHTDTGSTVNMNIIQLSKRTLEFTYTTAASHIIHGVYSAM
jgi:hypothetical protein